MNKPLTALTDSQRQQLLALLQQRKAALLGELGAHQRESTLADVPGDDASDSERDATDPRELAQANERSAVRDAEATRDHDELIAVRAALARMHDGSYGECIDCGKAIAPARLQAQPAAARCIDCQSAAEQQG